MQWPTTVARRRAVPLLVRRKRNGCSLFGCSARSNRLCENGCPDFSLLLLLGADEQIFGPNKQVPKDGCGPWRGMPGAYIFTASIVVLIVGAFLVQWWLA